MGLAVTVLGSSSATPTKKRYPSAQVIHHLGRFLLIDCGEGTQMQFRNLGLSFSKLDHIFISHLHGDHYFGLPGLINTLNLLGRKNELRLYAFQELYDILEMQLNVAGTRLAFPIIFTPLKDEGKMLVFENETIEVHSFPLKHRIPTCGFIISEKQIPLSIKRSFIQKYYPEIIDIQRIKQGGDFISADGTRVKNSEITEQRQFPKSYVYCSDTIYDETLIKEFSNPDLLYHEATYGEGKSEHARLKFHSTAMQAARIAQLSGAKHLMIGHFSARYDSTDELVIEAQSVFKNTFAAYEGLHYEL